MSGAPPRPPASGQARPPAAGTAGAPGSAASTPSAPPHPAAQVITNMHNLIAMDKEGKLKPAQILQCRNLIVSHTRSIVLKNTLERKTNPLLHLTPNLNVLLPFNGSPALISKEAFEKNIAMAAQEGQRIRGLVIPLEELKAMLALPAEERNAKIARDPQLKERFATSVTWYTKGGADGFLPLLTPANRPLGAAGGANTPRPPPGSRPGTPQQAPVTAAAVASSSTTAASAPPAAAAVPPSRPTSSSDFKEEPDEPATSTSGVTVKTEPTDPASAVGTSGSGPPRAESSSAANGAAARPPPTAAPTAPPQPPPPPPAPPVPAEPEEVRRKRKLEELLAEIAPGTQFELGVTDVFSEVLSCFVDEAARGSAKLAKHRKSDKVGTKDMAYFLDKTYGISVPGFNVQVPQKVHTGPENRENKLDGRLEVRAESKEGKEIKEGKEGRRKMVAPRAAKYKAVEGQLQEQ